MFDPLTPLDTRCTKTAGYPIFMKSELSVQIIVLMYLPIKTTNVNRSDTRKILGRNSNISKGKTIFNFLNKTFQMRSKIF